MMGFYLIVCHWFACAWYILPHLIIVKMKNNFRFVIGKIDLEAGRTYGWLSILANKTGKEFTIFVTENGTQVLQSYKYDENHLIN